MRPDKLKFTDKLSLVFSVYSIQYSNQQEEQLHIKRENIDSTTFVQWNEKRKADIYFYSHAE